MASGDRGRPGAAAAVPVPDPRGAGRRRRDGPPEPATARGPGATGRSRSSSGRGCCCRTAAVEVFNVHPYPPRISTLWRMPVGLDTRQRDEDLLAIRGAVGDAGDPGAALVVGDINTTPFEPGYRALSAESAYGTLVDAHEAVGTGPGFTWRPSSLEALKLGLLRHRLRLHGAVAATGRGERGLFAAGGSLPPVRDAGAGSGGGPGRLIAGPRLPAAVPDASTRGPTVPGTPSRGTRYPVAGQLSHPGTGHPALSRPCIERHSRTHDRTGRMSTTRMSEPRGTRDLNRLKWATMVLPIVFVWLFELGRFLVLDPQDTGDGGHVASAMIMGGAIVVFATIVSLYLDRAQKQLVAQNKDLTVTHAVSSAVRGGLSLPDLLEQSLDRVVTETGALAGIVTVNGSDGHPLVIQRPAALAAGPRLARAAPRASPLDPAVDGPALRASAPASTPASWTSRSIRGAERIGHLRLAFHPPVAARRLGRGPGRHRGRDRGRRPAGHHRRGPPPPRAGARGPVRRRPPAHRPRRPARRPRHDHRARPGAAGRRAGGGLPERRRAT